MFRSPSTENLYEEISDTELADLTLSDVKNNPGTYAEAAARGTTPDADQP